MAVYTIKGNIYSNIVLSVNYLSLMVYVLFSPEYVTSKETPFLVKSTFEF